MTTISFPFNNWDDSQDSYPTRPGSSAAWSAMNAGIEPGQLDVVKERNRDTTVGALVDGMIKNVAGSLEWLRRQGVSSTEIEQRVRAYLKQKSEEQDIVRFVTEYRSQHVSDPNNKFRLTDPAKRGGRK